MKLMKAMTIAAAIAALLAIPASARAGSILSYLDPVGVTHMEDNDWEFIHGNGDNFLQSGEFLVGMLEIQRLNWTSSAFSFTPIAGTDSTLTGLFFLEVTSATQDLSGDWHYSFGAPDAAEYAILAAAYGLPVRNSVDSLAIVYEDSSNPYVTPAAASKTLALDSASEGTPIWEFGIDGGFWTATTDTNDITAINILESGFGASTDVTHYYPGSPQLDPINFLFPLFFGDMQLRGGFEPLTGGAGVNFQAQTDTDFYIQAAPIPEPSTIALLGLGLMSLGVLARRRSK